MTIKKVVIPQIEVKYVCELSEEEYERATRDVSFYFHFLPSMTKIKTPKPLADDEVSVEEVDINKYIYGGIMRDCPEPEIFLIQDYDYKPNTAQVVKICQNTCSANSVYSNENDYFSIYLKSYGLYQFETQQEFFEWGLKQIKDNLND